MEEQNRRLRVCPNHSTTHREVLMDEQKTNKDLKTARAYHIKLALARFWDIRDPDEAEAYLKRWYFWATHNRLDTVIEVARGIKNYWQGVINYTKARITNGCVSIDYPHKMEENPLLSLNDILYFSGVPTSIPFKVQSFLKFPDLIKDISRIF